MEQADISLNKYTHCLNSCNSCENIRTRVDPAERQMGRKQSEIDC